MISPLALAVEVGHAVGPFMCNANTDANHRKPVVWNVPGICWWKIFIHCLGTDASRLKRN